jgi:hypothetical protein
LKIFHGSSSSPFSSEMETKCLEESAEKTLVLTIFQDFLTVA